jgi:hypothetical protein
MKKNPRSYQPKQEAETIVEVEVQQPFAVAAGTTVPAPVALQQVVLGNSYPRR